MPSLQRGAADATAKRIGFEGAAASGLENDVGYAGAAHAPLMLAHVLETARPGEKLLLVGFGQGADALIFEITDAIDTARPRAGVAGGIENGMVTDSYLRRLSLDRKSTRLNSSH